MPNTCPPPVPFCQPLAGATIKGRKKRSRVGLYIAAGLGGTLLIVLLLVGVFMAQTTPPSRQSASESAVRAYLDKHERQYTIHSTHPVESLADAFVYVGIEGLRWVPFSWGKHDDGVRYWAFPGFQDVDTRGIEPAKCRGLRVEFTSDEGFGRTNENDNVFVLDQHDVVKGYMLTHHVMMGKPGEVEQWEQRRRGDSPEKKLDELISSIPTEGQP
jgi:hypothetical protein